MKKKCILLLFLLFFSGLIKSHNDIKPKVSIITSIYKGDDFIAGFLSDITRQTIFEECELILINANSPGNEEPIIKEYLKKFPNIIYKKLDHDPGLYPVWNMAIKMARADLITNANIDDRRNPESLELQLKALEENPNIDLVYSDFYVTFTPNETYECNSHPYSIFPDEFSATAMYKCITGPQPMWRKNVHEKYGYFDETFISAGDFEMWNRAASMGSIFRKIPGVSGLYYLNPTGLSTDNSKRDVQETELQRINAQYSSFWITHYHYYCTAADSKYFPHLLNLIGNIHEISFNALGEIAVFDLGLTQDQIEHLKKIKKVSVHTIVSKNPDILKQFKTNSIGRMVPGWYAWKFVVLKQALEMFPYVLWIDAGTTLLKPLDNVFKYIQESSYFLCTMGDEKFFGQVCHPIKWGATEYVKQQFQLTLPEKKWILNCEPLLSGTIGVSRKALDYFVTPLCDLATNHLRLFEDDGTTESGFGTGRHDQTILSVFAYLRGLTIHRQDHTQQTPMFLNIEGKNEEFYITWNSQYVNDKTYLYNSRSDVKNFEHHLKCIKYKT